MNFKLNIYLIPILICDLNIYINCESETSEMMSQGRVQYQLLRERGNLPRYGSCWKSALETVDIGCRELSEDTQSDIALALTNCFLEQSGLETYNCDYDKKQNVRQICISSMSDKAFNTYTEFYTHTLNMCWFLRGQIWQETISENTRKVGRQLENSAAKQEKLLEIQRESLELQDQMLKHGKIIENVLANLSISAQNHHELLMVMGQAVSSLQSWVVGEISWVNTLIFYISCAVLIVFITSTPRTINSRLPILSLLLMNIVAERIICMFLLNNNDLRKSIFKIYGDINDCIQLQRNFFLVSSFMILVLKSFFHEDVLGRTKFILENIQKQNEHILKKLEVQNMNNNLPNSSISDKAYLLYETSFSKNNLETIQDDSRSNSSISCISGRGKVTPVKDIKYNLRSRHNTPISIK